ncbi:glycosyltransferase family 2 protein [Egicoccus halophilus]|uniref:Glycosyl transferase n=1 Tax=Egicoccus halophilus TaxID=1670830 RepID=A0A8J3A817_9ACTN|nr:glycosyltransferase family 2 protein [Egicoccus halophilus]GGI06083.1 hypothetical protein GCM10011354_17330 [Egicoccus halophilus]
MPDTSATTTATSAATGAPDVAVVVPAHAASDALRRCLEALRACDPPATELVVVVDGADPDTIALAERHADRVVALPDTGGPARARNAGVAASVSDLIFFVDSDVVVRPDFVGRIQARFLTRPTMDAMIGSYDATPPEENLLSQYKNLLNHYVHQRAGNDGWTFWGACGAIRRSVFERVGGFDESYTRPCIEDIELGHRLHAAGHRIEVAKDVQVTHLKRWTARTLLRADVLDRALPWSELIVERAGFTDDLNISRAQRGKAVLASAGLAGAAVGLVGPRRLRRPSRGVLAGSVTALAVLDAPLLRFFARQRGPAFAVGATAWHWWSYVYSAATFGTVLARRVLRRRG